MNLFYSIAAVICLCSCVSHFYFGYRRQLQPMLASSFDLDAKTSLVTTYHGVSVFLSLSTLVIIACAFEVISSMHGFGLVLFIAMNYGILGIWQIYIAKMSDLEHPFRSQFHWILYMFIAIFSLLGLYTSH